MSSRHDIEGLGWEVSVDDDAGELHIDHPEADASYVLDEDGGLRLPAGEDVGEDLHALRERLAGALDEEDSTAEEATESGATTSLGDDGATEPQTDDDWTSKCDGAIACLDGGSSLKIQPTSRLEIDAPTVSISANVLEIESKGNATLDAAGVIKLDGSLITLN